MKRDEPIKQDPVEDIDAMKKSAAEIEVEKRKDMKSGELWNAIGFHKPLAGFYYNLSFSLFNLVLSIIISGVIINIFYPYPESNGYRGVTGGIFGLFFTIMDLGTHMTMDRFIADAHIKNPKKMLQYIQYFIYYQWFTGLFQTTVVSLYALFIVPSTSLSYGVWLMLIVGTYQWPGFLGVFGGVLGSLQQYHRTAILGFITGEVFQRITELSFVLLGRIWGMNDPAIGEIKEMLIKNGAVIASMSGSGSAVFGIFNSDGEAVSASKKMGKNWCRVVSTLSKKEELIS